MFASGRSGHRSTSISNRDEITEGVMLGHETEQSPQILNTIRPHEGLEMRRPTDVYLTAVPNLEHPNLS